LGNLFLRANPSDGPVFILYPATFRAGIRPFDFLYLRGGQIAPSAFFTVGSWLVTSLHLFLYCYQTPAPSLSGVTRACLPRRPTSLLACRTRRIGLKHFPACIFRNGLKQKNALGESRAAVSPLFPVAFCFPVLHLNGFIIIGAGLLAAGVTFVTNWLALIPWRRSKRKHWSEQARLVYPVVVAARSDLLTIPSIFTLAVLLLWPDSSPLWLFTGITSVLGAYAGTLPLDHEVFPRIPFRDLLRQAAIGILLRFLIWFVFIGATILMPDEFNQMALGIGGMVIALWVLWSRGGLIWLGRKLGLFRPAPERLQKIAAATSEKMNVPFREVLLMRSPMAQAFALPSSRQLLFTQRLLELLSDAEIAAICAHEMAHLTESKMARYSRSIRMLTFMPWIFFNPLMHNIGLIAFYGLLFITIGVPRIYRRISRKLESRADQMAKANEGDAGTYARALTRLYEDNFLPAVTAKNRATHPHLYDRIEAAGVVPDFPRPMAASSMTWHGMIFAGLAGMLFAVFAIRALQLFGASGQ
jgi:Zn-dependent protease with chaperone function